MTATSRSEAESIVNSMDSLSREELIQKITIALDRAFDDGMKWEELRQRLSKIVSTQERST